MKRTYGFFAIDNNNHITFDSNIIFKYDKFDNVEQTLTECTLKASSVNKYNDPFECSFFFESFCSADQCHHNECVKGKCEYFQKQIEPKTNLFFRLENAINKYKVICFSQDPYEPLMWAHYSANHTGVCYCFEKTLFPDITGRDITYSTMLPHIAYMNSGTPQALLDCAIERTLFTKSNNWAYEKEIRFAKEQSEDYFTFIPRGLKAIIIGINLDIKNEKGKTLPDCEVSRISKIADLIRKNSKLQVEVFYAIKEPSTYKIAVTDNPNQRENSKLRIIDFPMHKKGSNKIVSNASIMSG